MFGLKTKKDDTASVEETAPAVTKTKTKKASAKYGFTKNVKEINGVVLKEIVALADFGDVKKGDIGGFIESEKNLSQKGNCWISKGCTAFGAAEISGDTIVT